MNNTKYRFNIEVNKAGQRVVVVDDSLITNNCEPIKHEDFDAVLYKTEDVRILINQFTNILNVFSNNAFQFKPFFINPRITRTDIISSSDGVANDIDSSILINETARIKKRMLDLGFKHFEREPSFWTNDNYFYAFVRHGLTRGDMLPKMEIVKGSPFGYIHPILYVMFSSLNISAAEFLAARNKFQGEFAYIEPLDLVSVTHVCPKCYDKGLIYMETCPKCGSIDIEEHNMIHHFRCANITPENSYMREGKLICPKCTQELHHIGVDYDRPTTSYNCNSCNINFSNSRVVCECETCRSKSTSESLVRVKMMNMTFNAKGKKMLPITDYIVDSDSTAKFPNILSFNQFKDFLQIKLNISQSIAGSGHVIRVYRSVVASEDILNSYAPAIISRAYNIVPSSNIAIKKNICYLMVETLAGSYADKAIKTSLKELENAISNNVISLDYIEYDGNTSPSDFISNL